MKKGHKIANVLMRVRECLDSGCYYDTFHAAERKQQRSVPLPHIEWILRNGYHEKSKDTYKPEYNDWNYSIRGVTVDGREIRVVVAFDEDGMLIITVIAIAKRSL